MAARLRSPHVLSQACGSRSKACVRAASPVCVCRGGCVGVRAPGGGGGRALSAAQIRDPAAKAAESPCTPCVLG